MKIRSGFISNSSSSSYVIIVEKKDHLKAMAQLTPFEQKVIEYLISEEEIFDIPVTVMSYVSGNYSTLENFDWSEHEDLLTEEEGDEVSDVVWRTTDKYEKLVTPVFSHCEDM